MKPPRRRRYRGTHPRRFEEKYKELDPARYPAEAGRVESRGQTPAGAHIPVLLEEVVSALAPAPGDIILDATLGHGGHAEAIAPLIAPGGRLIGVDLDREELERTVARLAAKGITIRAHASSFAGIGKVLAREGIAAASGILADLGASSMQIDNPERGFSFKHDGPLDMRMDRSRGKTAEEWLREAGGEEVLDALERWGEEPSARSIARAILEWRARGEGPLGTRGLERLVLIARGLSPRFRRRSAFDPHPAARTFQAIRMAVNREEESLKHFLRILPHVLRPGGRAAILAFHPGEDRLAGEAFREGSEQGLYSRHEGPIRAEEAEMRLNPRARSAMLRWVERSHA